MPGGYVGGYGGQGGYGLGGYGGEIQVAGSVPYYLSLFTSEWRQSKFFMAFAVALLTPFTDLATAALEMAANFDIDTAVGVQLDVLGTLIGVGRTLPFTPTVGSPVLSDADYLTLLRATIARNQWNGQIDSLYALWKQIFPGGTIVVIDNQNMTATIILVGAFTSTAIDMINAGLIVPRPQGVQYNIVLGNLPAFGFDTNSAYVSGFDRGHWA